ncbi:MAG: putative DNA binding domain-containing protein [Bacteroidales bacterium]|nr:putative DNA binding domain-containing protein [Bacteroidales bacterium]
MTREELLEHLRDIEWENFEVKTAKTDVPKDVWETVSAFSNTSGGWIVFGVSEKKKRFEVVGVDDVEKLENDMLTTLRSKTKFNIKLSPKAKRYKIEKKNVLAFYIPSSDIKPVYFNGIQNTFIRTGSGDQQASEFEINALYRDQKFGTMSGKVVEGTSVDSLNAESYKNFRDYLQRMVPRLHYNKLKDDAFNAKLHIVKNGKLTYGGLLFLGKNEEICNYIDDFRVDYLEIPGTSYRDAATRYTFRIQEQENLWEYYFALFQRLTLYANNPFSIGEMGIGHEDTKEMDALREALVNMLTHTDYFSPMKPRIRVFTNRIEFENPGALPRPLEQLLKADESIPRNPVLAKLFRVAKLCETAGYGFDKMLEWKYQTGNEVLFESTVDKTKFTFMLDENAVVKSTEKSTEKTAESTEKTEEGTQKTVQKTAENYTENEKTVQKTAENYTENEKTAQKIMLLMSENPAITKSQLSENIGISVSAISQQIAKLKKQNLLRRDGADKGGKWVIIDEEKQ